MSAKEFSFSQFPELEDLVKGELHEIYSRKADLESAVIEVRINIDLTNQLLAPEVRTKYPATTRKFLFKPRNLIRENDTFLVVDPHQTSMFEGKQ